MQAATRRQRSTISPASQRHTRTSKPYLCVGVMEREKWSLRDGEESIRGGKIPPPLEPAPPLTPIGTPATPKSAQGGGPRPIQTRAHGSPGRPTRPHSRGKTTPPHHSVSLSMLKTVVLRNIFPNLSKLLNGSIHQIMCKMGMASNLYIKVDLF